MVSQPLAVFKICGPGACTQPKETVLTQQFTAGSLALMGRFVHGKPVSCPFTAMVFDKAPFWDGPSALIPAPSIQDREVLRLRSILRGPGCPSPSKCPKPHGLPSVHLADSQGPCQALAQRGDEVVLEDISLRLHPLALHEEKPLAFRSYLWLLNSQASGSRLPLYLLAPRLSAHL